MNRISWKAYVDNPAVRGYRNFIKKYGGRECAYHRQIARLQDGRLHDMVEFEILAEEWGVALDKKVLSDYIDICELISETEEEIRNLRKKEIAHDKVTGSNPEFPYQLMSFHVSGVIETDLDGQKLKRELELLKERKYRAEKMKAEIDRWMKTIPARMQRIVRRKYFERKTWEEVAIKLGKTATADSARMEFERFLQKK